MIEGIVLLVVVLSAAAVTMYVAWRRTIIPWVKLTTSYVTIQYVLPQGMDPRALARAVDLAIDALSAVWPRQRVIDTVAGTRFFIVNGLKWQNIANQTVGGELDGNVAKVPRDFSSMAHELAHACQRAIDNVEDDNHQSWAGRGITRADEVFREAL